MVWGGQRYYVGAHPGQTMTALDTFRKALLMVHAPEKDQLEAVEMFVEALQREIVLGAPDAAATVQNINKDLKQLFSAEGGAHGVLLGLRVLLALISVDYWTFPLKISFFYNLAKGCLPSEDRTVVGLTAECMSSIASASTARDGGLISTSIIEEELRRAHEWLAAPTGQDGRWFSACCILDCLLKAVPEVLASRSDAQNYWHPVWSDNPRDQLVGVAVFKTTIDLSFPEEADTTGVFNRIVAKIFEGLKSGSVPMVCGSLRCLRELLDYSHGQFQTSDYRALVDSVLDSCDLPNEMVQQIALEVLAKMSRHYEDLFVTAYLDETLAKIAKLYAASGTSHDAAFAALSEICTSLSPAKIEPHVATLAEYVRNAMDDPPLRRAALQLLGLITHKCPSVMEVELVGEDWNTFLRRGQVADNYFDVIETIIDAVPSLKKEVTGISREVVHEALQTRDVESVINVLTGIERVESCIPEDVGACHTLLEEHILPLLAHDNVVLREAAVKAGLSTLRGAARLVDRGVPSPRAGEALKNAESPAGTGLIPIVPASTRVASSLAVPTPRSPNAAPNALKPVAPDVTERYQFMIGMLTPIVDLAVVDMDAAIRHAVLAGLDDADELTRLCVAQPVIDCLFMAFNDTVPAIRQLALRCLCKLSASTPVFAGLTRICMQLAEDNPSRDDAEQTHCTQLLAHLVRAVPAVASPMASDILQTTIDRLREPPQHGTSGKSPKLVSSLLATLGEINDLVLGDEGAGKVLREFIPYVVDCLDDRQKRLAAVQVLIKIVCTTGLVIDFYGEFPTVLPILLGFLQSKEEPLHNAVMKLIGTIGAVDPLRAKNLSFWAEVEARDGMRRRQNAKNAASPHETPRSISARLSSGHGETRREQHRGMAYQDLLTRPSMKERASNSSIAALQAPIRTLPGLMDLLPAVALQSLIILLGSPPHQSIYPRAIDSIRLIIKSLSHAQLAKFCPPVLEPILKLLKKNTSSRDIHSKLLQLLITLVTLMKSHIEPHCEPLLNTIKNYWDDVLKEAAQIKGDRRGSIQLNLHPSDEDDEETLGLANSEGRDHTTPIDHTPSVPVEMLLMNVIALIEEIGRVSPAGALQEHSKWIFQCLFQSMQIDKMERLELVQKCFDAFRSLVVCVNEHLHEVLPLLLDPVSRSDVSTQLKVKALTTLHSIIEVASIADHTGRVLHHLLQVLRQHAEADPAPSGQIVDLILRCIHQLCKSTGKLFVRFIPLTKKMLGPFLMKDAALVATLNVLETQGESPPELRHPKPEKRPVAEDTPKVLTCVLAMGVEAFVPDTFKRAIVNHLKIPVKCIEILRTKGPACTVEFRFVDMDAQSILRYHHAFLKLARAQGGQTSALAHELRLHEAREKEGGACYPMQVQALQHMWNTRGKRKARDWEEWINRFSVELLKHSPSRALQACYHCGQSYLPFARELFSYSFVACFQELDEDDKIDLLANMNHALRCELPPFVLHMILSLAEFMEEERYRSVYTAAAQSKFYKLARHTVDAKFGVGYADVKSENSTRVTISKVQAGGPGDLARLPVGGKVLKLNNMRVKNVKQLSELLAGQTQITLEVQLPNAIQRFVTKPGPFFEIDLLADVCESKQLLAKALHYQEERFRDSVSELKKANQDDINKLAVNFIELCSTLIQLSNNLGLREGANGVLDYLKRYFQDWVKEEELTLESERSEITSFAKIAGRQIDSMLWIERRGYEKLQWWSKAIKAYKAQAQVDPTNRHRYSIGIMRCYKQLGRWEHLLYEAKRGWAKYDLGGKEEVAVMAAHGAWILSAWSSLGGETIPSHWDFMETCVQYMPINGGRAAEREFFLAILAVHKEQYAGAINHIGSTRKLLETRLSSQVGESYARAYNVIVWLQKVQSLEEVIEYKAEVCPDAAARRWEKLREVWHKRMFGMQPTVEHWQDMLGIMALVLEKDALKSSGMDADDLLLWLKFVSICRRCNRNSLAESTLLTLMGFSARNFRNFLTDDTIDQHLSTVLISSKELIERNVAGHVCLSYFKHLYHCDMRNRAADELTSYLLDAVALRERASRLQTEIERLEIETKTSDRVRISPTPTLTVSQDGRPGFVPVGIIRRSASADDCAKADKQQLLTSLRDKKEDLANLEAALRSTDLEDNELMSKLHLTLGEWVQELHKDNFWEMKHRSEILDHFEKAIDLTPTSSRAWHCWGLLNYRIAFRTGTFVDEDQESSSNPQPTDKKTQEQLKEKYLVESLRGFFKALEYLEDESFCVPNLLRILTIWFRYAQHDNIERSLKEGSRSIQVSIWIYVLPQLVARVSFPQQRVRALVEELLTYLGTEYPHHVVYPLTVCAVHGDTVARRRCAQAILDRLSHGEKEKMFTQAKTVSQGLIKTAISWAEYWASGIEDAAKIWTDKEKVSCDEAGMRKILMDLYPMMNEEDPTDAEQAFLREYQADLETAKRYLLSDNLHQAWEKYKKIWERIQDGIARTHTLQLGDVAPQLVDAEEGFETAVPGVNPAGASSTILIHRFWNEVTVIQSKQKPKVVIIEGDDGVAYKFLLKGHEDIRQDERVMQLFGLINALFQHTDDLYHINIMTTPVVPLSDNVGLIGWLEKTETIYRMISDYRKDRNIPVNLECSFIVRMGQLKSLDYYYKLPPAKKVEILSACVERTPSDCLRRVFWTRTATSEIWLEYRTQYVKTLATMSMVGYILGLGDRHLNNIMLTNEGAVVHIDFGDCFEVALNRQRFPEQVPFRLTRLLVQALEASGTEGTFRYTSESVMRCLRKNRDSLTSLLETFVYDPLINWRLLETVAPEEAEAVQEREAERCKENTVSAYDLDDAEANNNGRPDDEASIPTQREFDETKEAGVDEMNIPEGDDVVPGDDNHSFIEPSAAEPEVNALDAQNNHGLEIASALLARSALIRVGDGGGDRVMSAPMSAYDKARSVKVHEGVAMREGWEGELVNEKAKKVVIRIREKLTGYDFPKTLADSRQSVSPSPLDTGLFDMTQTSRSMMLGGGSYEGSWVMKSLVEDDECDIGVSVAHREMWWLNNNPDVDDVSEDARPVIERCTVQEQVQHLILAATDVENLSKMFIGWCPFW